MRRRGGGADGERGGPEAEEAGRQVGGEEDDVDGRTPAEALICRDLEPDAAEGGGRDGGGVGQRARRPADALLWRGEGNGHERRLGLERQRPACNLLQLAARTEAAAERHAAPHVARAQLERRRDTAAVGMGGGSGGGGAVDSRAASWHVKRWADGSDHRAPPSLDTFTRTSPSSAVAGTAHSTAASLACGAAREASLKLATLTPSSPKLQLRREVGARLRPRTRTTAAPEEQSAPVGVMSSTVGGCSGA
eukprot:scaffold75215_cov51-Phaeocystis_antarctica.AAC.2